MTAILKTLKIHTMNTVFLNILMVSLPLVPKIMRFDLGSIHFHSTLIARVVITNYKSRIHLQTPHSPTSYYHSVGNEGSTVVSPEINKMLLYCCYIVPYIVMYVGPSKNSLKIYLGWIPGLEIEITFLYESYSMTDFYII